MNDTVDIPAIDRLPGPARDIRGFIESATPAGVSGWCVDLHSPQEPLLLEFTLAGRVLGFTSCDQARPDLASQGMDEARCGFHWQPSRPLGQDELADLEARVFETTCLLPRMPSALPGPAQAPAPAPQPPAAAAHGRIVLDQGDASGLSGWIACADGTSALTVELHADGRRLAGGAADQPRPDVQAAGVDPGTHGFNMALPDILFDGVPRALRLYVPELDAELTLAPLALERWEGGSYRIRNGILAGWIDPAGLASEAQALVVADGASTIARVAIEEQAAGVPFQFRVELPYRLSDGALHAVTVNLRGTRYRLAAQGGALSLPWQQAVTGRVDQIDKNGLGGWAYDTRTPDAPLDIALYDGDALLCQAETALPRSDVNKLFGISGVHGFHLPFPAALYDGVARNITVRAGTCVLSMKVAYDVPLVLTSADLAAVAPEERYQGFVEHADSAIISGWAWDRKRPDTPVHVAVYIDGELVETVAANRFSARLRSQSRSGHHVFLVRLPARLMNGAERAVRVVVVEGGLEIKTPGATLKFPLVSHFGAPEASAPRGHYRHALPANLWGGAPTPAPPAPDGGPELSLIVLNWNGAGILEEFLESLLRIAWRHSYELLLVDHGSEDGSLELARGYAGRLPLRLVPRGANFSFSASNNHAAQLARGRCLVFANNDLVMLHDCLAPLRAWLEDPHVGAAGARLLEPLAAAGGGWDYVTHHQGVQFRTDQLGADGPAYYAPIEIGEQSGGGLAGCYDLPVATGALLMVRAADFHAVGGFDEGYVYGMEDVDLCLTLRERLGKAVLCDTAAVALHNRSATRDAKLATGQQKMYSARLHAANRRLYVQRHGRRLARTILRSLVEGGSRWRPAPLRVTFAVTSADPNTPAGDFFTAFELGEAMQRLFGWEVMFADMKTSHLPGTDVLVIMRHDYKVERVHGANPGLVTVAWVRNRVDQWVEGRSLEACQLVFASSQRAVDEIRAAAGRDALLLPIAANARRFLPLPAAPEHASDVTFTGNYWGAEREAIGLQDLGGYRFAIYGHGWQDRPDWRKQWRGAVAYAALPQIYSSSKIVLDDSHPVTRDWHSLNSRVFDALACGRLVLTNCTGGARELFGDLLPTFSSDAELRPLIRHYLDHPDEREALAAQLREDVLAHHTYDNRAAAVRDGLRGLLDGGLRFAIKIGVPDMQQREEWGDYHFALGIARALRERGHVVRIDILPDWYGGLTSGDDVVIVLRGLSAYKPQPTAVNLAWLISHPDHVSVTELQQYDHVFVASESFAGWLRPRLQGKVDVLMQCTDPALFFPERDPALQVPDTIFIGNSRGVAREAVRFAQEAGIDFAVYGTMWDGIMAPGRVHGGYIPNARLRHYYSAAKVVLSDHWADMREQGFVSNRLFDAGACGAAIVTDDMAACRALFGDAMHYYRTPSDLAAAVADLGARHGEQRPETATLRDLILSRHTFGHRADSILEVAYRFMAHPAAAGVPA